MNELMLKRPHSKSETLRVKGTRGSSPKAHSWREDWVPGLPNTCSQGVSVSLPQGLVLELLGLVSLEPAHETGWLSVLSYL